jgi:hypothetical protein
MCPKILGLNVLGLGLIFKLREQKTNKVNKKFYLSLSPLFPLRKRISLESRVILVRSLVLSKLYYAAVVWFNGSKTHLTAIDKLIRTCARYALDKDKS